MITMDIDMDNLILLGLTLLLAFVIAVLIGWIEYNGGVISEGMSKMWNFD